MFKKILIVLALVSILTVPVMVLADDYGLGAAAPTDLKTSKLGTDVPSIVGSIVGVGLSLLGVIFFLLILYAGILWMTALGNEKKVDKAKEIMEAAGIGLMIVLSAYAITTFLFKNVGAGGNGTGEASGTSANTPGSTNTASGQVPCCCNDSTTGVYPNYAPSLNDSCGRCTQVDSSVTNCSTLNSGGSSGQVLCCCSDATTGVYPNYAPSQNDTCGRCTQVDASVTNCITLNPGGGSGGTCTNGARCSQSTDCPGGYCMGSAGCEGCP